MHFDGIFEEIQDSLCMVIVMSTDANNKAGKAIDKGVEDDLPSNQTLMPQYSK